MGTLLPPFCFLAEARCWLKAVALVVGGRAAGRVLAVPFRAVVVPPTSPAHENRTEGPALGPEAAAVAPTKPGSWLRESLRWTSPVRWAPAGSVCSASHTPGGPVHCRRAS